MRPILPTVWIAGFRVVVKMAIEPVWTITVSTVILKPGQARKTVNDLRPRLMIM